MKKKNKMAAVSTQEDNCAEASGKWKREKSEEKSNARSPAGALYNPF
jgi:hypothetical protein